MKTSGWILIAMISTSTTQFAHAQKGGARPVNGCWDTNTCPKPADDSGSGDGGDSGSGDGGDTYEGDYSETEWAQKEAEEQREREFQERHEEKVDAWLSGPQLDPTAGESPPGLPGVYENPFYGDGPLPRGEIRVETMDGQSSYAESSAMGNDLTASWAATEASRKISSVFGETLEDDPGFTSVAGGGGPPPLEPPPADEAAIEKAAEHQTNELSKDNQGKIGNFMKKLPELLGKVFDGTIKKEDVQFPEIKLAVPAKVQGVIDDAVALDKKVTASMVSMWNTTKQTASGAWNTAVGYFHRTPPPPPEEESALTPQTPP